MKGKKKKDLLIYFALIVAVIATLGGLIVAANIHQPNPDFIEPQTKKRIIQYQYWIKTHPDRRNVTYEEFDEMANYSGEIK